MEKFYIQCSKDKMIPIGIQKTMCDNLGLSEMNGSVSVMDTGHTAMVTQAKELCKRIDDWIQEKFASG